MRFTCCRFAVDLWVLENISTTALYSWNIDISVAAVLSVEA
jgi:hypothetical protein